MNDKQRFLFIPQEYLALLNNCPLFLDSTLLEVRKNRNVRIEKEEGEDDKKKWIKENYRRKKYEQKSGEGVLPHQHYFVMRSILQKQRSYCATSLNFHFATSQTDTGKCSRLRVHSTWQGEGRGRGRGMRGKKRRRRRPFAAPFMLRLKGQLVSP